jgi:hypothetical protein
MTSSGKIQHIKYDATNKETVTNTPTAIERARAFLLINFAETQMREDDRESVQGQAQRTLPEEIQIPKPEIREHTFSLIQDFTKTIGQTPEFRKLLVDKFFSFQYDTSNPFAQPTTFQRGEYKYEQYFQTNREGTVLSIAKQGIEKGKHPMKYVTLEAPGKYSAEAILPLVYNDTDQERSPYNHGKIQHTKVDAGKDLFFHGSDNATNTTTAINRLRNFLTTNFGQTQEQTPANNS